MRNMGQRVLQNVFLGYLKLLEKTVKIEWQEETLSGNSQIFGFWHEDSFFMNLVLKNLAEKTAPVDVVVTADTRGDYIQYMIEKCGGSTLRIPDGYAAFGALKKLMQTSYEQTRSMAVALDGPLGPRHEPKKTGVLFIRTKGRRFCGNQYSVFVLFAAAMEMGSLCNTTPFYKGNGGCERLWRSE